MYGKYYGAYHNETVTRLNCKAAVNAQKIKSDYAERNTSPHNGAHLFPQQKSQKRHYKNIKRGNESGFAAVGTHCHAELLKAGGDA